MPARHRTMLAGIVALAAALRFATLDVQSYWFDEATTVHLLRMDLGDMLRAIPNSESTPPLYYVVAWFWTKLFGTGEVGLRSLSALAGTATVPIVYAIGARMVTARAGLVAALLVAANPLLVWYSQEARAYALLVLFSSLTLLVLPRALEPGARRTLAAWAVFGALAVATHYFAVFLLAPQAVWLLCRHGRRALAPLAAVGVVGLALLPIALDQAENDGARFIRGSSLIGRIVAIPKQFLVGYDAPGEVVATIAAGLLALYAVYLLCSRASATERRSAGPLAAITAAAIAVPIVLALAGADYLITRNLIVALIPLLLVLATGYGAQRAGRAGIAAAAALAVIGIAMCVGIASDERRQRDNWRGVAERLGPAPYPRMLVVSPVNGRIPLEVYLPDAHKAPKQGGVPVREIDVIGFTPRGPGDATDPPRPPSRPALPGFGPPVRTETETYTLDRYYAAEPLAFPDEPLYGMALGGAQAELVVQSPKR
jgi:mannosyltransferase